MARWLDPFWELERFQRQMNSLFGGSRWARQEIPPVRLATGENAIVLSAELPGVKFEELDLSVTGDVLTLRGTRRAEAVEEASYHRHERVTGPFVRTIQLPERVDGDKAEAHYSNGVLTVRIPKAPEARPRRVEIQSA